MNGFSRVSIPESFRRTIRDIKEIAGEHSDEDVYAMLKECNMDPNETTQKLLCLDTFHEVKTKRDRRKMGVTNRANEEHRQRPGMQWRGTRSGKESYFPSYSSDGVGGGRQLYGLPENGYAKPVAAVMHKAENKAIPAIARSAVLSNGVMSPSNGSSSIEANSQLAKQNIGGYIKRTEADEKNLPPMPVVPKQLETSDPGPTPTPTPTLPNTSRIVEAGNENGYLQGKSDHTGNITGSPSVSGLYSSASDPVLVPSLNPRIPGAVGIIKRETGNHRHASEINANPAADTKMNVVQNGIIGQSVTGTADLTSSSQQLEYEGIERTQMVESAQLPSSRNHHNAVAKVKPEAAPDSNLPTLPAAEDPSSAHATSEIDINLQKLQISERQSVIFPNHLHVPEALKNALTFGSLDAPLGQDTEDSISRDDPCRTNVDAVEDPSPVLQLTSSTAGNQDPEQPQSPQHVQVNLAESHENILSGSALRYEQSKQEILRHMGGSHNPFIPPIPDYGLNLVPPVVGSHLVQLGGLGPQAGNSLIASTTGSTPAAAQPAGISMSPQIFPYLRQPYPPTYMPYNPYFSQFYMPHQNTQQLISPSAFPLQPSVGNMYMPPTAASGVKFPSPQMYKQGSLSGNLTQLISSGYGSYGASGLCYTSSVPVQPGTSASNDDIVGSELKEKNTYPMVKQNEDLHLLASASGREMPAMQANIVYNIPPQAQPVAYSPAQAGSNSLPGIYHPTQSLSAASLIQALQQSHPAIGGSVDSIVPPLTSYPQPHQQHILMPQPHTQMTWNQQLMSRENM